MEIPWTLPGGDSQGVGEWSFQGRLSGVGGYLADRMFAIFFAFFFTTSGQFSCSKAAMVTQKKLQLHAEMRPRVQASHAEAESGEQPGDDAEQPEEEEAEHDEVEDLE